MFNYAHRLLAILAISAIGGCGRDTGKAELVQQVVLSKLSIDIRLKGTPVVKILSRENTHWLMTETIDSQREEHQRTVKLVSSKELLSINHAVSNDEYLADIALGPEAKQLWVAVAPVKTPDIFVLRLINDREIIWEISIARPDKKHDFLPGELWLAYTPGIEDFIRIVSDGSQVFIAGRSAFGYPFFASVRDRKIIQNPMIIGPAFAAVFIGRTGGVYSVMDQLVSQYKLHLAKCSDKIIVSWLASGFEINRNLPYYGFSEEVRSSFVATLEITQEPTSDFHVAKPTLFKVGGALLQGISCDAENDLVLSGSSRIKENGGSVPFIIRHGQISFLKDAFEKSASAQAVLTLDGKLIIGGSSDWHQNPHGLSIDGGVGFLKIGDSIETFGETRSEVRSISHTKGLLCYAGMIAGPTTHSHDHNPESITGDGFFKCRN